MRRRSCPGCRKENCSGCRLQPEMYIGKGSPFSLPEDFRTDGEEGLGMAFDIGTTSVAGMLWDLGSGTLLETETFPNPQNFAGGDVVSRIAYACQGKEQADCLRRVLTERMDQAARQCLERTGAAAIRRLTVVGNTAMCQLFAGISLAGLLRAPFHKGYTGSLSLWGAQLGFNFLKETEIRVLPSLEAFVGADALAVYICVKRLAPAPWTLAVDVGTNGEILLLGEKETYACSTAAGPALEGAAVSMGMTAAAGAIERVELLGRFPVQDVFCQVIGGGEPVGICGSGLVDALALLLDCRILRKDGCLLTRREARMAGIPEKLCRRLDQEKGENRFLLTEPAHPVYLTGSDIRQLQLAGGAIRAGIETLLGRAGISPGQLEKLYLTGAFGSSIRIKSAVTAGLLPDIGSKKCIALRDGAGVGASLALLSENVCREMEQAAGEIRHVELAEDPLFERFFLQHLSFGNTD